VGLEGAAVFVRAADEFGEKKVGMS